MDLEDTMLSGMSEQQTPYESTYMYNLKKKKSELAEQSRMEVTTG